MIVSCTIFDIDEGVGDGGDDDDGVVVDNECCLLAIANAMKKTKNLKSIIVLCFVLITTTIEYDKNEEKSNQINCTFKK